MFTIVTVVTALITMRAIVDSILTVAEQHANNCHLTLVRAESALRTMVVTLPVATPPLLEIGAMNRTKLTEWCQQREH